MNELIPNSFLPFAFSSYLPSRVHWGKECLHNGILALCLDDKYHVWNNGLLFSCSVVSDCLWSHGLQHARLPCPSLSLGVCPNSCLLSWWPCEIALLLLLLRRFSRVRLCAVVVNSLRSREPTRLLCLWDFTGKNTGVGGHFLLQGIFVTQGSNLGLLHCRQTLYCLSHQGSLSWWCHLQLKMSKAS